MMDKQPVGRDLLLNYLVDYRGQYAGEVPKEEKPQLFSFVNCGVLNPVVDIL